MPELLDPSEIMFTPFEPKTKNRYIMYMEGIPAYLVKTANRPTITFEEIDSILYCLEKRLSVDEIVKKTEIKKDFVEKICQMHENSWHKRLPPKRVVQNMDEINKLISRMENDANI